MKYIQVTVAGTGQIFSLWHYEPEPEISLLSLSSDSALEVPSYSEISTCVSQKATYWFVIGWLNIQRAQKSEV